MQCHRPLLVLMRGNDQMNEAKLSAAIGGREFRPMVEEEIVKYFGSPRRIPGTGGAQAGSRGGDQRQGRHTAVGEADQFVVVMDEALRGRKNLVGGANELDHHFTGLNAGVDFEVTELCRPAQRGGGRRLSALRRTAEAGQGGGDRTHLQARNQVRRIDGRKGSGQGWQGSHASSWAATASASSAF